jgi:hypothetical protein
MVRRLSLSPENASDRRIANPPQVDNLPHKNRRGARRQE